MSLKLFFPLFNRYFFNLKAAVAPKSDPVLSIVYVFLLEVVNYSCSI